MTNIFHIHQLEAINSAEITPIQVMEAEEAAQFNEAFKDIVSDCTTFEHSDGTATAIEVNEVTKALAWFRDAIYYNVPHGKRFRGISVVMTHRILSEHRKETANLPMARVVGWCIEMLQSSFLILDDIMDESQTRRGQLCWHLRDNVGSVAINDSYFMMATIFHIIDRHLKQSSCYVPILQLFHDTMRKTTIGQNLDLLSSAKPGQVADFSTFTEEKYYTIVEYKTSYYSFAAPVRLGLLLSGITDDETHKRTSTIMLRMGQFFQIQDDYLDCFGDSEVMGKIGTDIEDGKCCWPIVTALSLANDAQKQILAQNYSRKGKDHVEAVKKIYRDLQLETIYARYEKDSYDELSLMIEDFSLKSEIPAPIFFSMLSKLCGRKK